MRRLLFVLGLASATARCQTHSIEPNPMIIGVVPNSWVAGAVPDLTITGDGFFVKINSSFRDGRGLRSATQFRAWVGEQEIEGLRWASNTSLVGRAPADLAAGHHSVLVRTPSGKIATMHDGIFVSEPSSTSCATSSGWAFPAWPSRWRVVLSLPASGEALYDFPAPVRVGPAQLQGTPPGSLRFSDAAGAALPFEIEATVGDDVVAWVLVPMIPADGATTIWMYAGNSTASSGETPKAVWNEFEAVYHLGPVLADRTGRLATTENRGTVVTAGRIGDARSFDGGSSIWLGADLPLLTGVTAWTASAWMLMDNAATGWNHAFAISVGGAGVYSTISRASICALPPDTVQLIARAADDQVEVDNDATAPDLSDGSWHLLTGVANYPTDETLFYVDGDLVGVIDSMGFGQATSAATLSSTACIGAQDGCNGDFMDGALDEIRLAPVARSAAWIAAEYASMQATPAQPEGLETCSP